MILMPRIRGLARGAAGKQFFHIDAVEVVLLIAEFAGHADLALFFEDRLHFHRAEAAQHIADPLTRAAAAKTHRRRLEYAHLLFVKQAMQ